MVPKKLRETNNLNMILSHFLIILISTHAEAKNCHKAWC